MDNDRDMQYNGSAGWFVFKINLDSIVTIEFTMAAWKIN